MGATDAVRFSPEWMSLDMFGSNLTAVPIQTPTGAAHGPFLALFSTLPSPSISSSFVPQRHYGVHPRRPTCGDVAGSQRHCSQ